MEKKRKRLRRYEIHQAQKLASDNKIADIQLQELNVSLHETKFIHEQSRKSVLDSCLSTEFETPRLSESQT